MDRVGDDKTRKGVEPVRGWGDVVVQNDGERDWREVEDAKEG